MSDAVAQAIITAGQKRGLTRDQIIACLATAIQESGLDESAVSPNGQWVGVYQQDKGYANRGTTQGNIDGFYNRLTAKLDSPGASPDIWKDIFWLQQDPGYPSADQGYAYGRQAYLTEIQSRAGQAAALYDRLAGTPLPDDNRPDFNEYANWGDNNQDRGDTTIDLFLLHTEEGGMNADALVQWMNSTTGSDNPVSYHYAISEDPKDHGVTVVDCVDTDQASWSVMASNNRSINLCFAGSYSNWSREQWMRQSRAIDVAAYLAAQDCKKYGFTPRVIPPPYDSDPPGISDHRYCTQHLRDGNSHSDIGGGFPWDVFAAAVAKYAGTTPPTPAFQHPSTDTMIAEIWDQLRGPTGAGWPQLGGRTLVDAVAELLKGQPKNG